MNKEFTRYLRTDQLPTQLCPGCGHGILVNTVLHGCMQTIIAMEKLVWVVGPGCSGWAVYPHLQIDMVQAPAGMAISIGVGIKKANPEAKVLIMCGDSDLTNGGNISALIHAARSNVAVMVLCANNTTAASLLGYPGPTTPIGAHTLLHPRGNIYTPLDLCKTIAGAGAYYVARYSIMHTKQLLNAFKNATMARGLSFIDALTVCPTQYGTCNQRESAVTMLHSLLVECVPGDILNTNTQKGISEPIFIGEYTRRGI